MATMDEITRKALEKSIAHHKRNLLAETPSDVMLGSEKCALCDLFNTWPGPCAGCPVSDRVGQNWCDGTPYADLIRVSVSWDKDDTPENRDAFRAAERRMITFLESLRPDDGANERAE